MLPTLVPRIARLVIGGLAPMAVSFAASAAPVDAPAIVCRSGPVDVLSGTSAPPGTRYSLATGMTVTSPTAPANWKIVACDANQIVLMHVDPATRVLMTAMATSVGLSAWRDEAAFEAEVRDTFEKNVAPGQHVKIDSAKAVTLDGRPCLDVARSGSVEAMKAADGSVIGPRHTRELLRACHLRDARGPEAAMVMIFKQVTFTDPAEIDDAADKFLASLVLPPWMR